MIYVNFIIIVTDSEENNRHYICNDFHMTWETTNPLKLRFLLFLSCLPY
jgi:hypothetical protein